MKERIQVRHFPKEDLEIESKLYEELEKLENHMPDSAQVDITVETEVQRKGLFSVVMRVFVKGRSFLVRGQGTNILSLINNLQKQVIRQFKDFSSRRRDRRRAFIRNSPLRGGAD